jgi:hypothetical protein
VLAVGVTNTGSMSPDELVAKYPSPDVVVDGVSLEPSPEDEVVDDSSPAAEVVVAASSVDYSGVEVDDAPSTVESGVEDLLSVVTSSSVEVVELGVGIAASSVEEVEPSGLVVDSVG